MKLKTVGLSLNTVLRLVTVGDFLSFEIIERYSVSMVVGLTNNNPILFCNPKGFVPTRLGNDRPNADNWPYVTLVSGFVPGVVAKSGDPICRREKVPVPRVVIVVSCAAIL